MADSEISVIVPARNMGSLLNVALASVWRQRHASLEVIVVDAGSTDDTRDVVKRHQCDGRAVRIICEAPIHPAKARNIGIACSNSTLVAFLDADDLWPEGKLDRQLGCLAARPDHSMVSGYVTYFETTDASGLQPMPGSRTETLFHVHVGACIYRREAFARLGGAFDEDLVYSEDVDLMLRVREAGLAFSILRTAELYYRRHPDSMMAQANPLRESSLHLVMSKSLRRRRKAGTLSTPLPDFSSYLEPAG